VNAEAFGSGLINDTYLCAFRGEQGIRKYILQRINAAVFPKPQQVMENVATVTSHIVRKLRAQGVDDPAAITPVLVSARDGRSFHCDENGQYWRVFHFIKSGVVFDTVQGEKHAYEVGRALGRFQALVSDLAPDQLHDTLPGFHYTPICLQAFNDAVTADVKGRVSKIDSEIEFIFRRQSLAPVLTDLMTTKVLPIRITHNDPKVNNVLVHSVTGEALCMLDLDTVKPGTALFDFGDCVRSAANPLGEDAPDIAQVALDLSLFRAVTKGYLRETAGFLTPGEKELLPIAVQVITFELGLRFLTDYLQGDAYFKVGYPDHNLHRARVQFRLLESMEFSPMELAQIVAEC